MRVIAMKKVQRRKMGKIDILKIKIVILIDIKQF